MDFDQASPDIDQANNGAPVSASESLATTDEPKSMAVTSDGDMLINGFIFTPTGLVPADPNSPPDFEMWDRTGVWLRYIHTGTQFWLGDWLNYGEANYGEKYGQAVEHTGYELHTLQTYAWVARQVPRSNRLEAVPFGHYANGIAALPPEQQAEMAQRVAKEGMTQSELKSLLAEKRAAAGDRPVDLWLIVKCKDQKDFDKLEKQMTDQGREVTSRVTPQRKPKSDTPKSKKAAATVTQKPAGTPKKAKGANLVKTKTPAQAPAEPVTHSAGEGDSGNTQGLALNAGVDEVDPGWLKDELYIPPQPNETPEQRAKRRKKINNARFRAKGK